MQIVSIVSMSQNAIISAIDSTFRDIMRVENAALSHAPFGGKIVIFGGDFRQTLPVVKNSNNAGAYAVSFLSHNLWAQFSRFSLRQNMRVLRLSHGLNEIRRLELEEFAAFVLSIGNDRVAKDQDGLMAMPPKICSTASTAAELLVEVFGDFQQRDNDVFTKTCILAPLNQTVDHLNTIALNAFPGEAHTVMAEDSIDFLGDSDPSSAAEITVSKNDLQPAVLNLKRGCPV